MVLLPQAIADSALGELEVERISSASDLIHLGVIPLAVFVALGGEALYAGIVAAAVLEWRAGHRVALASLARGLPYRRLIVADIVYAVGVAAGFALFVVPGVVFGAYFLMTPALIKLEGLGVRDAFRRSAELVRGSFRTVLALVLVLLVGTELASELLALPFGAFASELAAHLAVEALLEPVQGVVTVMLALALLEQRGEHEPVLAHGVRS